jgi:hypothetical protein
MSWIGWTILVLAAIIFIFMCAIKLAVWMLTGIRDWWHDGSK